MILTKVFTFLSEGDFYALNITDEVQSLVATSGIQEGMALLFYQHTTGALMIVEHEAGILVDLEDALDRIVPPVWDYKHHLRGYDQNGASHVRTALLNVSVTVPVLGGRLSLGEYQEILMVDMDSGQKPREVLIQVMGE